MIERLNIARERYNQLNNELSNPDVLKDMKKTRELSKEAKDLEETVKTYDQYEKVLEDINAAKEKAKHRCFAVSWDSGLSAKDTYSLTVMR